MTNLLIDTSSAKVEFGYSEDSQLLFNETLGNGHNADTLTYFIKKAFDERNYDLKKLDYVTLSNGPGSFTGLRIGSAIAKGICFTSGSRLIEIPSLDVIANKLKRDGKITSLIFSNSNTLEFYYCSYKYEKTKLVRISDYGTGKLDEIFSINTHFAINGKPEGIVSDTIFGSFTDVSNMSGIKSLNELARDFIAESRFSDYVLSEPFYMKEFIPKN